MIYVFPKRQMAIHKALTFTCSTHWKCLQKPPGLLHGPNSLYRCAGSFCTLQLQVDAVLILATNSFIHPLCNVETPHCNLKNVCLKNKQANKESKKQINQPTKPKPKPNRPAKNHWKNKPNSFLPVTAPAQTLASDRAWQVTIFNNG